MKLFFFKSMDPLSPVYTQFYADLQPPHGPQCPSSKGVCQLVRSPSFNNQDACTHGEK